MRSYYSNIQAVTKDNLYLSRYTNYNSLQKCTNIMKNDLEVFDIFQFLRAVKVSAVKKILF